MKDKDKNLRKAIDNLPSFEPDNDLWGKIEAGLDAKAKQATQGDKLDKNLDEMPKQASNLFALFKSKIAKSPTQWAMAATVLLGMVGGVWWYNQTPIPTPMALHLPNITPVQPVFSKTDVPFNHFVVDTEVGGTIKLPNGTKLNIPQNAFVDKNNQPIEGKVQLHYREFHEAAQILASGIDMTYDSAGITQQFESAGMFELRGFQQENPVFIAPDKNIEVKMASFVAGNDFRFYYYDQTNKHNQTTYNFPIFSAAYAQSPAPADSPDLAAATGSKSGYWKYLGIANTENNLDRQAKIDSALGVFSQNYQTQIEKEKADIAAEQVKAAQNAEQQITIQRKSNRAIDSRNFFRLRFDTLTNPATKSFANLVWEYAGKADENHHPRSSKNYWVLDRAWREVELTQDLYRPVVLGGHPAEVNEVKFSPNGKLLATAAGGGAKLWDSQGKLLHDLEGHPDVVKQLLFSADSKHLLSVAGGLVSLWDTKEGKLLQTFGHNPNVISAVTFADNDTKIVAYMGGFTKIWDLQGKIIALIEAGGRKSVQDFATVTNQKTNTMPYEARIVGTAVNIYKGGELVNILKNHQNFVQKATFSADGQQLITFAKDQTIKIWSVAENFKLLCSFQVNQTTKQAEFAPDGKSFVSLGVARKNKQEQQTPDGKPSEEESVVYLWKPRAKVDANLWQLNLYCKPKNSEETKQYGDNVAFTIKIYQETETEQQIATLNGKQNPALVRRVTQLNDLIRQYDAALAAQRKVEDIRRANEAVLLRSYKLQNFGIYNWDRPEDRANGLEVTAEFALADELQHLHQNTNDLKVFFITGDKGTIVQRLAFGNQINLRFMRGTSNQLVVVLPDSQVVVYTAEEFRALVKPYLQKKQAPCRFVFSNPKPILQVDDLKAYLQKNKAAPVG